MNVTAYHHRIYLCTYSSLQQREDVLMSIACEPRQDSSPQHPGLLFSTTYRSAGAPDLLHFSVAQVAANVISASRSLGNGHEAGSRGAAPRRLTSRLISLNAELRRVYLSAVTICTQVGSDSSAVSGGMLCSPMTRSPPSSPEPWPRPLAHRPGGCESSQSAKRSSHPCCPHLLHQPACHELPRQIQPEVG